MQLRPYQQKMLEELRKSKDPFSIMACWERGTGKSIVINAYIQELREMLESVDEALSLCDQDKFGALRLKIRRSLKCCSQ